MAGSTKRPKSWREKLESDQEPRIVEDFRGRGRMLISTPLEVNATVRKIPKGKLVTVKQIMETLADDHDADLTCPMTTGIFLRIVAEVAEEDLSAGKKRVTPYWRVLKAGGTLNQKFPGGVEAQAARLIEEGHTIEPGKDGRPHHVKNYQGYLQEP